MVADSELKRSEANKNYAPIEFNWLGSSFHARHPPSPPSPYYDCVATHNSNVDWIILLILRFIHLPFICNVRLALPETYFSYLCQHYTSFNRTIFRPLISPQFTHFGCHFGCFRKYGNAMIARHEHKYQWPWQQQNYKHCNIVRVRAFFTTYKWPHSLLHLLLLLVLRTEQPNIQSERHQTLISDCKQTGIAVIFGNELDGRRCWWLSMTFNWKLPQVENPLGYIRSSTLGGGCTNTAVLATRIITHPIPTTSPSAIICK